MNAFIGPTRHEAADGMGWGWQSQKRLCRATREKFLPAVRMDSQNFLWEFLWLAPKFRGHFNQISIFVCYSLLTTL